ncbi:hypothetical protein TNCT_728811 [Trichonephila clavata]|uniref:Uncharacterized protein n=1 Tax=Trichonephila clavata TaxID=2740835 RepID=A0A8X6KJX6_TRICU|nr:hypothetical protein TNCT_728811 [Trichonephila clavata]
MRLSKHMHQSSVPIERYFMYDSKLSARKYRKRKVTVHSMFFHLSGNNETIYYPAKYDSDEFQTKEISGVVASSVLFAFTYGLGE